MALHRNFKYLLLAVIFWCLLFLGWEWWHSFPKGKYISYPTGGNTEKKMDSLLIQSMSDFLIPGMAVGLVQNEKIIYLKAFGFQSLREKDSMTLQSKIPVASVSKIFTALLTSSILLERGLSPKEPISSLLTQQIKLPEAYPALRIRDLLTHQSGLRDKITLGSLIRSEEQKALSLLVNSLPDSRDPEAGFEYADLNFDLLGYLLQKATQIPFDSLILERILKPAGMKNSEFTKAWPQDGNSMEGYQRTFLWKRIEPKKLRLERFPSPSSGLVTSAEEMAKFLLHLSRGELGIFQKELAWLYEEDALPIGFQSIRLADKNFIGHFGNQAGFSALFVYSQELELGLFLLTNARDNENHREVIAGRLLSFLNF
jgi:CubicO group peptidase (beta-lactamase class C family)